MPADFPNALLIANAAPLSVILRRRILTILDELGGAGTLLAALLNFL